MLEEKEQEKINSRNAIRSFICLTENEQLATIDFMDSEMLHKVWGKTANKVLKLLELPKINKQTNK